MARPGLSNNVKFKLLCRLLNLPRPYVRGLLETMWDVAHESGNPVLGSPDAVEAAAEWPGERNVLFAALRDCRLIDQRDDDAWEIHDYWHHCPEYVKGRLRKEVQRRREKEAAVTVPGQSRDGHGNGCEVRATPSPSPSPTASPNGEACSEPAPRASEPASDPVVMTFPTSGKGPKEWHLRESKLREYAESYPGVDVLAECRKARQWAIDNPRRRKTPDGMGAFLNNWLKKEQNCGGAAESNGRHSSPADDPRLTVQADRDRARREKEESQRAGGLKAFAAAMQGQGGAP
jgi:hypothetical protein